MLRLGKNVVGIKRSAFSDGRSSASHPRCRGQLSPLTGELDGDQHRALRVRPVAGQVPCSLLGCNETAPHRFCGLSL